MSAVLSGIECPKCGSIDLKVLATRRQDKSIVRQRECDRRHKFSTVEQIFNGLEVSTARDCNPEKDGAPGLGDVPAAGNTVRCAGCPILPGVVCRLKCSRPHHQTAPTA